MHKPYLLGYDNRCRCEQSKTILNEFYQVVFRKNIYHSLEELQKDLDDWLVTCNQERSRQGKRCQGRTGSDARGLVGALSHVAATPQR